jgi:hypothetical protein
VKDHDDEEDEVWYSMYFGIDHIMTNCIEDEVSNFLHGSQSIYLIFKLEPARNYIFKCVLV